MAGEISSAWHTKDESLSWWYTPPLLAAGALFAVEKCPREDAHDFWSCSVESSWRYLPTTRDIYEPIGMLFGVSGRNCQARHMPKYETRTEPVKDMPSEWMTFWKRRIVEILSRIAAHPKPFHDRSRAVVRRRCERYDV